MATMKDQLAKQDTATTALGAKLNDFAQKMDVAIGEIKQANENINATINNNEIAIQGTLAQILKKMNPQQEHADAPQRKTPRTNEDGKSDADL